VALDFGDGADIPDDRVGSRSPPPSVGGPPLPEAEAGPGLGLDLGPRPPADNPRRPLFPTPPGSARGAAPAEFGNDDGDRYGGGCGGATAGPAADPAPFRPPPPSDRVGDGAPRLDDRAPANVPPDDKPLRLPDPRGTSRAAAAGVVGGPRGHLEPCCRCGRHGHPTSMCWQTVDVEGRPLTGLARADGPASQSIDGKAVGVGAIVIPGVDLASVRAALLGPRCRGAWDRAPEADRRRWVAARPGAAAPPRGFCARCGRGNHLSASCRGRKTSDGVDLPGPIPAELSVAAGVDVDGGADCNDGRDAGPEVRPPCARCGKRGHPTDRCRQLRDLNGAWLGPPGSEKGAVAGAPPPVPVLQDDRGRWDRGGGRGGRLGDDRDDRDAGRWRDRSRSRSPYERRCDNRISDRKRTRNQRSRSRSHSPVRDLRGRKVDDKGRGHDRRSPPPAGPGGHDRDRSPLARRGDADRWDVRGRRRRSSPSPTHSSRAHGERLRSPPPRAHRRPLPDGDDDDNDVAAILPTSKGGGAGVRGSVDPRSSHSLAAGTQNTEATGDDECTLSMLLYDPDPETGLLPKTTYTISPAPHPATSRVVGGPSAVAALAAASTMVTTVHNQHGVAVPMCLGRGDGPGLATVSDGDVGGVPCDSPDAYVAAAFSSGGACGPLAGRVPVRSWCYETPLGPDVDRAASPALADKRLTSRWTRGGDLAGPRGGDDPEDLLLPTRAARLLRITAPRRCCSLAQVGTSDDRAGLWGPTALATQSTRSPRGEPVHDVKRVCRDAHAHEDDINAGGVHAPCGRCGRAGHRTEDCRAPTHVNGMALSPPRRAGGSGRRGPDPASLVDAALVAAVTRASGGLPIAIGPPIDDAVNATSTVQRAVPGGRPVRLIVGARTSPPPPAADTVGPFRDAIDSGAPCDPHRAGTVVETRHVINGPSGGWQGPGVCARCGKRGHQVSNCFQKTNIEGARLPDNGVRPNQPNMPACARCGMLNHATTNCQTRRTTEMTRAYDRQHGPRRV